MLRSTLWLLWVGCTSTSRTNSSAWRDVATSDVSSGAFDQAPPVGDPLPQDMELTLDTPLIRGAQAVFSVRGGSPGAEVYLAVGTGPGAGPCPQFLRQRCLGVVAPVPLGSDVLDDAGEAEFAIDVPPDLPIGLHASFQAVRLSWNGRPPGASGLVDATMLGNTNLVLSEFEAGCNFPGACDPRLVVGRRIAGLSATMEERGLDGDQLPAPFVADLLLSRGRGGRPVGHSREALHDAKRSADTRAGWRARPQ